MKKLIEFHLIFLLFGSQLDFPNLELILFYDSHTQLNKLSF